MIGWIDIYNVVSSVFPLYVALLLGYGSVKWGRLFSREQCDGINRFIALFILPFFSFGFTSHMNPYTMNLRLLAADVVSKIALLMIIALWGMFSSQASYHWCVTTFSLCTLTSLLFIGVPVMQAIYGQWGVDLTVQLYTLQSLLWTPVLLLLLEFRSIKIKDLANSPPPPPPKDTGVIDKERDPEIGLTSSPPPESTGGVDGERGMETAEDVSGNRSCWALIRAVLMKMAVNPNVYANVLGLAWALVASRFKFKMPGILEGSVEIMSKAGVGMAMSNIGIFTAMQPEIIACGSGPAAFALASRFVIGPAIMALSSLAVGLRGPALRFAIIQAAIPHAITAFVFAKEYELHARVLSTAVVIGTVISLPLLIGYYVALEYAA